MKLAVLADVHGNLPALEIVLDDISRWGADEVIVNGDLISRGPYSLAALRMIERSIPNTQFLLGNHEAYVFACVDDPRSPDDPTFELSLFAQWTAVQMGDALQPLRQWADHLDFAADEAGTVHVTHGSRLGNRDAIRADTPEAELPAKLGEPRELFIASHTHRALVRRFRGTQILNTGSVGQPLDGDRRAAYVRCTFQAGRWRSEVRRLDYDYARAQADFWDSGFMDGGGPVAQLILLELQQARMHVGPWFGRYLPAIRTRQLTVQQAVDDYLDAI